MCGICGFVGEGGAEQLNRMVATLVHRGPDEAGAWVGEGVALGMRRLSIIDVATGHQPIFNEDDTIGVVFNGEIYNFVELRRELLEQGHRFRTGHSDTEVIVHLYEQYGDAFADKLNGMFAIALWDKRRARLLLVRDRVGIKPLYYAQIGNELVFGSEPKALLAHPGVGRQLDPVAIHHYFSLKNIPAPLSVFQAIRQLRAGEMLSWQNGTTEVRRWWRLSFREDESVSEAEASERIRELLEDSVRLQMRSDVPVGAYLSGGVDSSSVVALMSRLGGGNVKTFTLVYEEEGFPQKDADREFARRVAQKYGTEHYERVIRFRDVPDKLSSILAAFDEPFSGVISTYFISDLIAEHVKVALSGDGADELFGSYLPHRLAQPLALAAARPEILDEPTGSGLFPFGDQLTRLRSILARGDEAARRMEQYLANDASKREIYTRDMLTALGDASTEADIRGLYGFCASADPLNRCLFVDFETLLPDQVLAFSDRLSMAHSIEVRPPFLDHRLVEYAATLPGSMKIKGDRVKSILKDAVTDLLPTGLVDRPKEGFVMPINDWLLHDLRPFVMDHLSASSLARHGLLEPNAIQALLRRYYDGEKGLASRIWNLVTFQAWWESYVGA